MKKFETMRIDRPIYCTDEVGMNTVYYNYNTEEVWYSDAEIFYAVGEMGKEGWQVKSYSELFGEYTYLLQREVNE